MDSLISNLIIPLSEVPKCSSKEMLGSALVNAKSSHEGIFVFDSDIFRGIVSPYLALFQKRYPYASKVNHCLFKPPYITLSTSLYDIVEFMVFSKIYTLPVFNDKDQMVGVISANKIIDMINNTPKLFKSVVDKVIVHDPVTANVRATVKEAYELMRENKISRVVLVNDEGKLAGIVARKDLQDAFIAKTVHQRYVTKTTRRLEPVRSSFDEEVVDRRDSPIREFATTRVVTASQRFGMESILKRMISSGKSSIVITDTGKPVAFVSRHDLLKAFISLELEREIPLIIKKQRSGWREQALHHVYEFLDTFAKKTHPRYPIRQIELHVDQPRNAAGLEKNLFTIKLHLLLKSGRLIIASSESRKLEVAMSDVLDKIDNQLDYSDRQKH